MLKKIISGGLPGVELAALDAAIKMGIAHGGWIIRGLRPGDIPEKQRWVEPGNACLAFRVNLNFGD